MLALVLTLGTVATVIWLLSFRSVLGLTSVGSILIAVTHTFVGLLCVSLFAGLESLKLSIDSGMSLFGAIFLMPAYYYLVAKARKLPMADFFDVMTLCLISVLIFARVNCIISGCCLGSPIPGMEGIRWPTRELEIAFQIVLLVCFAVVKAKHDVLPGAIFPLYMVSYGGFRFIEEFARESGSNSLLHTAHFWSVLSVGIGLCILFEMSEQNLGLLKERKRRGD